jgi:hypothetical protein
VPPVSPPPGGGEVGGGLGDDGPLDRCNDAESGRQRMGKLVPVSGAPREKTKSHTRRSRRLHRARSDAESPKEPSEHSRDPFLVQEVIDSRTGQTLRVRFYKPRPDRTDWVCHVQFEGIHANRSEFICGADAIQSLVLAIDRAGQIVRDEGEHLRLASDLPAELAFPPRVPTFDVRFVRHIRGLISKELIRYLKRERARKKRVRPKP